jgi:uncharacterized membrane protein YjgN (DUF898 family)
MTTADALSPPGSAGAVQFLGKEAAYWRLRIKGAGLLVLTLGIYRFWFATDVRRYLWSSTEIGGETLEYIGLATELLGGFLLAIAILVPLYTAIASAALTLDTSVQAIAAIGFVLLVLLGQFALYRARRYRLTRTVFRGVRFDQHGSAWRYALYALFWWALVIVTLGLAYPWAQAGLQRFKMRHTSYGDLAGSFDGSGSALFVRSLPIWCLVVGPIVCAFVVLGHMVDWDALNAMVATGDSSPLALLAGKIGLTVFTVLGAGIGTGLVAALLLYPLFAAMMMRWWISGLRFGAVTAQSHLHTGQVYRIYLRFMALLVLFLLLTSAAAGVGVFIADRLLKPGADLKELLDSGVSIILYVAVVLGASTIYQVAVTFAMWRLGAQTAELSGADALDGVRAAGVPSSALGEGLADALGVGGV